MKTSILQRNILSDQVVIRGVQVGCFAAAALIPLLAFRRMAELELSRAGLMVGVLAALAVAFFCTVLGVFLEIRGRGIAGTSTAG